MKYSYRLLSYILPGINKYSVKELSDILSSRLAEVEGFEYLGDRLKGLRVAKVVEKYKHPNSSKLYITKVDIGDNVVQVVAGAGNMNVGDFVPYTPVNVKVPRNAYPHKFDGIVRKMKLGGEISEGMLNSEFELGISNDHSRILILNNLQEIGVKLKAGLPLYKVLDYDDYLIEIENKALTHRGDVFSHMGLAREIKAILRLDNEPSYEQIFLNLKNLIFDFRRSKKDNSKFLNEQCYKDVNISLGNIDKDCWQYNLYGLQISQGQQGQESPLWLKLQLSKFEVGIVSYLVDLLNFITLIIGQPMHAFDLDKLIKNYGKNINIEVKYKRDGKLLALDNKEYKIKSDTLCITANNYPIAFAGVIGGKDTAIDQNTTNILLEIAVFHYAPIRRTMMMYGLNTMAGVIYARQQSLENIEKAFNLVKDYISLRNIRFIGQINNKKIKKSSIKVDYNELFKFLGVEFSYKEIKNILEHLGFIVKAVTNRFIEVFPPRNRLDINIVEDIYEEIIRIKGYENINPNLPGYSPILIKKDKKVSLRNELSRYFKQKGYIETVGYGFFPEESLKDLNLNFKHHYHIINAISPEVRFFRSSIFPQLLGRVNQNLQYTSTLKLFEIGHVAHKKINHSFDDILQYHSEVLPFESFHLSGLIADKNKSIKKLLGAMILDLNQIGLNFEIIPIQEQFAKKILRNNEYWNEMADSLNIWNSGIIVNDGNLIGIIGGLKSNLIKKFSFFVQPIIFEVELDSFLSKEEKYSVRNAIRNPALYEDYSFVVPKNITYYTFIKELNYCTKKTLTESEYKDTILLNRELIDIYYPVNVPDVRYITLRFYFISDKKKGLEKFVKSFREKIEFYLNKKLKIELKK